ncbi:MAG: GIY-YIG nuclease family protein [Rhodothermaceae bacterium]|nr:GIY-YIG nuclease family protein [Bacteroidota bacterium]MXW14751.1 GIY-YIG nuclease family protein [Rhodothermaceae bacterium]MDE2645324.1 GIY-YIG nuclease family protein [Bacteroidota bacterium]MXW32968.1 GIY-YIG nuclease family protein [Rhodothermaceae bacterium]MXX98256.1 GIY-YIG nuclease family protein [Rhodothermaceae bacterium]
MKQWELIEELLKSPGAFYSAELSSKVALEGFDKRRREYKHLGWIYVARNPCFVDAVFKIGQTQVSPSKRIEQLSASTSVYRKFELVYFVHVSDNLAAEGYVHQLLKDFRLNPRKEFFNAPIMTVVKALDEAGNLLQIPMGKTLRAGMLPPALEKRIISCPGCKKQSRVPLVGIDITVTCVVCNTPYKVTSE